jgi:hypothetical protein
MQSLRIHSLPIATSTPVNSGATFGGYPGCCICSGQLGDTSRPTSAILRASFVGLLLPKKSKKDSPPGTLGPDLAKYVAANGNAYGIKGRPDISEGTWRWLCVKPSDKEGWLAARFLRIPMMIACRIREPPGHSGGSLS